MKRLAIMFLFIILPFTYSHAVSFIDVFGHEVKTGETDPMWGGGLSYGLDIRNDLNLLFKGSYTTVTQDKNAANEADVTHMIALAGFEYIPQINLITRYRILWKTSLLLGMSRSEVKYKTSSSSDFSDMGLAWSFWTGIQYNLTQYMAPFLDIGYHESSYNGDMKNASIKGFQMEFGLRFYLDNYKDATENY